jgi:hypothetical protein
VFFKPSLLAFLSWGRRHAPPPLRKQSFLSLPSTRRLRRFGQLVLHTSLLKRQRFVGASKGEKQRHGAPPREGRLRRIHCAFGAPSLRSGRRPTWAPESLLDYVHFGSLRRRGAARAAPTRKGLEHQSVKLIGVLGAPNVVEGRGYHGQVLRPSVILLILATACGSQPSSQAPQPWTGFFHPPAKPGGSITNTKQCECRACDPSNCCSAEKTESTAAASPECNKSYEFSEQCGITVQTCTPRCYSHVWRVSKQASCSEPRPLACCG